MTVVTRGMRAPFLAIGGNNMYSMMYDANFTYDSSMPIYEERSHINTVAIESSTPLISPELFGNSDPCHGPFFTAFTAAKLIKKHTLYFNSWDHRGV